MKAMNINAQSARQSEERMLVALDGLNDALSERQFLVGNSFSRADLTACALLSPYCLLGDAEVSANFPEHVRALRDTHKTHRFFGWVRDMYKDYRQPFAAGARAAASV